MAPVINPPAQSVADLEISAAEAAGIGAASPALSATNAAATRKSLAALAHQEPVDHTLSYVKTTAPTGTAATVGEKCLDTVAKKLYTCVSGPAWDAGTALSDGDRCAHVLTGADTSGNSGTHTANHKIYTISGTTLESVDGVDDMKFLAKDTREYYTYDADESAYIANVFARIKTSVSRSIFKIVYGGTVSLGIYVKDVVAFPSWTLLFAVQSFGNVYFYGPERNVAGINRLTINDLAWANAKTAASSIITKVASANVRNSHNAEATTTSATYVKLKTITLTNGLLGQARFLFDLKTSDSGTPVTAYGRIYRNGVALGTEQTDVTGSYATKSQDITQDWAAGDTVELWAHADGSATVSVQNFQIAYDDNPVVAVASANS